MSRAKKPERRVRAARPEGQPDREVMVDHEAAPDAGPEQRLDEILGEYLEVAARLSEDLDRRLVEAGRENANPEFDPYYDREIQGLKKGIASIRKIVAALEGLKRALNERLKDVVWFRNSLDPAHLDYHDR